MNHYRSLARAHAGAGPILELGCGTGRLLVPLARDGHRVLGFDRSAAMLTRARERAEHLGRAARGRVRLVRADMRAFAFAARFPLVVCPFNAFQHLYTRFDVDACLARVREHLAAGGRFALDVLNPDLRWLARDPNKRWARTRFKHPTTGVRYEYSTNQTYDPVTQIAHMRIYYESIDCPAGERRTRVVRLAHRQFFPAELDALLAHGGFRIVERRGGWTGEPLEAESECQVLLCALSVDKP